MERVTVLRRALVALLVAAPALTLTGPVPAADAAPVPAVRSDACMQLEPKALDATLVRSYADAADDVFAGRVLDKKTTTSRARRSGHAKTRSYAHVVRVDTVFRGDLRSGDRVMLLTKDRRTPNGLGPLRVGGTYLMFTTDVETGPGDEFPDPAKGGKGGDLATVSAVDCAGTTALPDGLSAALRDQVDQLLAADNAPTVAPVLSDPAGGASEPPSLGRSVAPGIALALLGVLGLVLFSWLGRRRA